MFLGQARKQGLQSHALRDWSFVWCNSVPSSLRMIHRGMASKRILFHQLEPSGGEFIHYRRGETGRHVSSKGECGHTPRWHGDCWRCNRQRWSLHCPCVYMQSCG
jgi:hypothetical protein